MEIGGERTFSLATAHTWTSPLVSLLLHPARNKSLFTFRTFLAYMRLSGLYWFPIGECSVDPMLDGMLVMWCPLHQQIWPGICLRVQPMLNWLYLRNWRFRTLLERGCFCTSLYILSFIFNGSLKKEKGLITHLLNVLLARGLSHQSNLSFACIEKSFV